MFRRIFLSMLMFVLASMMHVSAEEYEYICDFSLEVTPLIKAVNQDGEFDHRMYYFNGKDENGRDNKCLIIVCHGFVDGNKKYGIFMHNRQRYDYAQAVAESIAYWTRKGE